MLTVHSPKSKAVQGQHLSHCPLCLCANGTIRFSPCQVVLSDLKGKFTASQSVIVSNDTTLSPQGVG